jgi:hypothetical protein
LRLHEEIVPWLAFNVLAAVELISSEANHLIEQACFELYRVLDASRIPVQDRALFHDEQDTILASQEQTAVNGTCCIIIWMLLEDQHSDRIAHSSPRRCRYPVSA